MLTKTETMLLKRFLSYYKPHKKMLALDMLASLLISVIGMVYPIVTNKMLNIYIPNKMYKTIVLAGILVLSMYALRMFLNYFVQYYGHVIGVRMQADMRRDLFETGEFSQNKGGMYETNDIPHPETKAEKRTRFSAFLPILSNIT